MTLESIEALRLRHYNAVVLDERRQRGTVIVFRVKPDHAVPPPRPGQWLELGLGAWEPVMPGAIPGTGERLAPGEIIRRAYSLSSPILTADYSRLAAPDEVPGFEFFLSLVIPPQTRARREPNLTGRLFALKPGDRLFVSDEPQGKYSLDPVGPEDDVLFLATGTGEAPHNLMIWDLLRHEHEGRIAAIVSVRHHDDLAYDDVHARLMTLAPRYRYHAFATRDPGGDGRHLQELFREGILERMAGFGLDPARTHVYLCGNPGMIGPPQVRPGRRLFPGPVGMVQLLEEERGFNADPVRGRVNLHYERYW